MAETSAQPKDGTTRARELFSRGNAGLLLVLVIPLVAAGWYLYLLHTPTPRVKTRTVITRNSLLPHRFAGPCINCHKIKEVGPVTMNRGNMRLFRLMPMEQRLLAAGQRVDAPSAAQRLRMPAITRDDVLPHRFVGVCSNCHVVLDVRPSSAYMKRAFSRAYAPLMSSGLTNEQIARAGAHESDRRELWRNVWGFFALVLFCVSSIFVVIRMLVRGDPKRYRGRFKIKKWFTVHEWASTAFFGAALAHWHYSDRGNNLLHLALIVSAWLTVAGFAMRYRLTEGAAKKSVRLLHSQRALYFGLIVLLLVGHLFAEFH